MNLFDFLTYRECLRQQKRRDEAEELELRRREVRALEQIAKASR